MTLSDCDVEHRQATDPKTLTSLCFSIFSSHHICKNLRMQKSFLALIGAGFVLSTSLFSLGVAEARGGSYLPSANRRGDFTPQNANTFLSETNGMVTWPTWRVVSSDGELNCRQTPNGRIVRVYLNQRDIVRAELRGGNAFVTASNGSPWMLTRDRCYVRANSQYIRPTWQ